MARRQLVGLGLTPSMLAVRISARRLVPLHRGVYAAGHVRLTRRGEWLAAVLAAGPGAALSHRSAAALHGLLPERSGRVDVATRAKGRTTNWIELHARQALASADLLRREGIPVTTVSRTLVDLAGLVPRRDVERAVNEAEVLRLLRVEEIEAALARTRGRRGPGTAVLREVLRLQLGPSASARPRVPHGMGPARTADRTGGARSPCSSRDAGDAVGPGRRGGAGRHGGRVLRSPLERRFAALLDAHALPRPLTNVRLLEWEVDAYWPEQRLVVELDGWGVHRTRPTWQNDLAKQNALLAAGHDVRRFTWEDVTERADAVAAQVRAALAR